MGFCFKFLFNLGGIGNGAALKFTKEWKYENSKGKTY